MSRFSSAFRGVFGGAVMLLGVLGAARAAHAQECTTDADCGVGQVCAEVDLSKPDCPPGADCGAPADPVTSQQCTGAPCATDDDCPDGMGCDHAPMVAAPCAAGAACATPDAGAGGTGTCEPRPIDCATDDDCPTGLTCLEDTESGGVSTCSSSRDGGVSCEPTVEPVTTTTRACGFQNEVCETDDDCTQAGFACITSQGETSCSGSDPGCAQGQECPPPPPTQCETSTTKTCFPARVDCTQDSDCEAHWVCFTLPPDAQDGAPAEFVGATDVCMPEGLALAIDGAIELARSSGVGRSEADAASGAGTDHESGAPTSGSKATSAAGTDGGSCMVSAPGHGRARAASQALMLLGACVLVLRRRLR